MAFTLFTPVVLKIDNNSNLRVRHQQQCHCGHYPQLSPCGLTLAFIAFALLIIRGAVDMP